MATNGRLRDYLTKNEVRALLRAAKQSKRYAARNHAMILLAFRHGFRASELVELRIGDVDFRAGTLFVRRRKGSKSSVHPGERAGLPVNTYAHQLRHACGYYFANKGCDLRLIQDYLGHKQIQRWVATEEAADRGYAHRRTISV